MKQKAKQQKRNLSNPFLYPIEIFNLFIFLIQEKKRIINACIFYTFGWIPYFNICKTVKNGCSSFLLLYFHRTILLCYVVVVVVVVVQCCSNANLNFNAMEHLMFNPDTHIPTENDGMCNEMK